MATAPAADAPLAEWLHYIQHAHPRSIDLGLERPRIVLERLQLGQIAPLIVTVAGTNGKGSSVAGIAAGLRQQGRRLGVYTSPHLLRFNERICIDGEPVADADIVAALALVETRRESVSLTYFEFATLAALILFTDAGIDVAVLEVGLGGRLDAVNLLDADVAVITCIDLDHEAWLGPDRESIGLEKAGIARTGRPLVCADADLPATVSAYAEQLGAQLFRRPQQFDIDTETNTGTWCWRGVDTGGATLTLPELQPGLWLPDNLAVVLQALALLAVPLTDDVVGAVLATRIPGRFETRRLAKHRAQVIVDVAHNPAGAAVLARRLSSTRIGSSRTLLVMAVMADKDLEGMVRALQSVVDIWYIAQVSEARCLPAQDGARRLRELGIARVSPCSSVSEALGLAADEADSADRIVITGSFFTVAEALELTLPAEAATS